MPLVSVLIPTFNSSRFIRRAVESALNQTCRDLEVIVHDNASSDDTAQIVNDFAARDGRVKLYSLPENRGPLRNWQSGLERCAGEYVKVLWSDDWIGPTFVEECVSRLQADRGAAFVFTGVIVHSDECDAVFYLYPQRNSFDSLTYITRTLVQNNMPFSPGCSLIRRSDAHFAAAENAPPSVVDAAERMGAGPDVLFMLRPALRYERVLHVPKLLSHFQARNDSFSGGYPAAVARAYDDTFRLFLAAATNDNRNLKRATERARLKKRVRLSLDRMKAMLSGHSS
jgi:glycosyltransferase involved in cell wall biosynthesis